MSAISKKAAENLDKNLQIIEANDFDKVLFRTLLVTKNPGQYPALHALNHLAKAKSIIGFDNEMATIRAITSEEEAATAVYHALKHKRYQNADKLNVRKHDHKSAFWPLLRIIESALAPAKLELGIELEGKKDENNFKIKTFICFPDRVKGYPDPPLSLSLSVNGGEPFDEQISNLIKNSGEKTIKEHIDNRANQRNKIFYASPDGIPEIEIKSGFFEEYRRRVTIMIVAFLLISQNPPQSFVQQCLDKLVEILGRPSMARNNSPPQSP